MGDTERSLYVQDANGTVYLLEPVMRSEVQNQMLRQLMDAMGESQHARPSTPREVWEQMLDKVRI